MSRILVVSNDFPPRQGGIQNYVQSLVARQPADSIVVFAPAWPRAAEFDAQLEFPVIRHRTSLILPVPEIRRRVVDIAREYDCDRVWFGAAAPLALLAPALRGAGVSRIMASTHGHETGWVRLPGARQLMRRLAMNVDVVTYITEFTRDLLAPVMSDITTMAHLPPGVDVDVFTPSIDAHSVRRRLGIGTAPIVTCVSRLVRRKGQDVLIKAWPIVQSRCPEAALLLVGDGPDEQRLRDLVRAVGAEGVHLAAGVDTADLPPYYAAGDVFAMPCRTRRGGLDVEGLGMVFLEAAACGRPVVVGRSGGAPEAVRRGVTGLVVDDPRSPEAVADRILELIENPRRAAAMGRAGRAWVEAEWSWESLALRWRALMDGSEEQAR